MSRDREPFIRAVAINALGSLAAAFVILLVVAFVGATDQSSSRFRFYLIAGTVDILVIVAILGVVGKVADECEPQSWHTQPAKFFYWVLYFAFLGVLGVIALALMAWIIPFLNDLIAGWTSYNPSAPYLVKPVISPQPTSEPS